MPFIIRPTLFADAIVVIDVKSALSGAVGAALSVN
jgi:hypothetical protein